MFFKDLLFGEDTSLIPASNVLAPFARAGTPFVGSVNCFNPLVRACIFFCCSESAAAAVCNVLIFSSTAVFIAMICFFNISTSLLCSVVFLFISFFSFSKLIIALSNSPIASAFAPALVLVASDVPSAVPSSVPSAVPSDVGTDVDKACFAVLILFSASSIACNEIGSTFSPSINLIHCNLRFYVISRHQACPVCSRSSFE